MSGDRTYDPYRIVRQMPAEGTGSKIIITADGREWRDYYGTTTPTGCEQGTPIGNRIEPERK